jgi:archaellum component FlaC
MTSLYTLSNELLNIIQWDENGEIDTAKLDELYPKIEDKVQNIWLLLQDWDWNIEKIKTEIERLKKMKEVIENKSERLKNNVKFTMIKLWMEKVETPLIKASIRKSESLEILDITKIPSEYITLEPKTDKISIKKDLKEWKIIEWVELKENININFK